MKRNREAVAKELAEAERVLERNRNNLKTSVADTNSVNYWQGEIAAGEERVATLRAELELTPGHTTAQ